MHVSALFRRIHVFQVELPFGLVRFRSISCTDQNAVQTNVSGAWRAICAEHGLLQATTLSRAQAGVTCQSPLFTGEGAAHSHIRQLHNGDFKLHTPGCPDRRPSISPAQETAGASSPSRGASLVPHPCGRRQRGRPVSGPHAAVGRAWPWSHAALRSLHPHPW